MFFGRSEKKWRGRKKGFQTGPSKAYFDSTFLSSRLLAGKEKNRLLLSFSGHGHIT
jgi:hypothetical protein